MKQVILFAIFLICIANHPVNGQKAARLKEIHQDAEYFFDSEDYQEAIHYFLQLVDNGYVSANINFKIGVCYLNMPGEETRAIPYLEEAVKRITTKYRPKELEETKAPLHALYYLGNAYRINNELSKALETYDKFTNNPGFYGHYNLNIVDTEIKACERAKIIQDSPVAVNWSNLGPAINTSTAETHPVVSGDEKTLVYLSSQKLYDAIFCSRRDSSQWSAPVNINPEILSDGEFYPTGLSYDGTELYLIKKSQTNSDIYVSSYKNGKWQPAKALSDKVNSPGQETYASISKDGKTLYFTSNRSNSRGGFDIYKSTRESNNQWSKAENLGKVINTREDEACPYVSEDGKTLYFSSKGHYNMGGFDIFYSTLDKDNKWSVPDNIGYPVNNTGDNLYYDPIGNGTSGYISRIKPEGFGKEDIYKIEVKSKFIAKESEKNQE